MCRHSASAAAAAAEGHARSKSRASSPQWCDADTLPLAIFDQRQTAALDEFTGDAAAAKVKDKVQVWDGERCEYKRFTGLWDSHHPLDKVLRDPDLMRGAFVVGPGFEVVVSTTIPPTEIKGAYSINLPMQRLQLIQPTPTPGGA